MAASKKDQDEAIVKSWFATRGEALRCVLEGMPSLPEAIRPTHYTESEPPRRKRTNSVEQRDQFHAFASASPLGFCLACPHGHYTVDLDSELPSNIALWSPLKTFKSEWGVALLETCARYGCVYGFGADWDEYRARNQAIVLFVGGGRSEQFLGKDYHRYVPGLYWLNYFSYAYLRQMTLDARALAERIHRRLDSWDNGTLLQLYEHPRDWRPYSADIEAVIGDTANFFSIRRVSIPTNITMKEYVADEESQFGLEWP